MQRHEILDFIQSSEISMVNANGLLFSMDTVSTLIKREVPGDIVECGVWKGGCSLAMLLSQKEDFGKVIKPVHLCDSFMGLPKATKIDGEKAIKWQSGEGPAPYYNNCQASKNEVIDIIRSFGFKQDQDFFIWEGWFRNTLPGLSNKVKSIALLRLDCDWYDSMMTSLSVLEPVTSSGGVVIIDDYYAWDGCARATHEYFTLRGLSYRLVTLPNYSGVYFSK